MGLQPALIYAALPSDDRSSSSSGTPTMAVSAYVAASARRGYCRVSFRQLGKDVDRHVASKFGHAHVRALPIGHRAPHVLKVEGTGADSQSSRRLMRVCIRESRVRPPRVPSQPDVPSRCRCDQWANGKRPGLIPGRVLGLPVRHLGASISGVSPGWHGASWASHDLEDGVPNSSMHEDFESRDPTCL